MKIIIEEIPPSEEESVIFRCRKADSELTERIGRICLMMRELTVSKGDEIHRISFEDIYYFEVVDGRSFFYCENEVFETKLKLYEFEEICRGTGFFRASKSMVLNSGKIDFIKPSLSGRFEASLLNGEKVVISRQYVGILKRKMGL